MLLCIRATSVGWVHQITTSWLDVSSRTLYS